MDVINYKGLTYPHFQCEGHAAQFAIPYAKHICKGKGYDIGCGRVEWALPGAIPIDINIDGSDAMNLPDKKVDYIFSSHCLEHLTDWVGALIHWDSRLKIGGSLFLYLPDYSQEYWRPWHNRKHLHVLTPNIITDCLKDLGYKNIFASGVDLNNSFMIIAEK